MAFAELSAAEPIDGPAAVDPDGPALIGYTSGTTADPKGVVHTHRTLGFEVRQLAGHQAERDRANLTGAPVGHAIGMLAGLLCPLVSGRPLYLIDGWDPPTVLDAMVEEGIGAGSGSTYFFTSLLDSPGFGPQHIELMRFIGLGGSPIPNAVADRADELGISLVRAYGCTEHPSVTGSQHADPKEKRIHTDGKPLEWVEVRTVDEDGHDVEVGQAGEILTRGPDRFAGYTDPELTAQSIDADGWFSTGDVGVLDPEGYLTITDRVKDIIIRGGENVSAAEVEQLLAHMDGVAEVAVVAAPDERLGEHGCAFFRMQAWVPAPDLEAVKAHLLAAGLARQKWPEEVRTVDNLPRTPSGKVQKFVLRERLRAGG
jgi:acyl-CoA synthetase (AMP-forming)/AMP-acid ligase II